MNWTLIQKAREELEREQIEKMDNEIAELRWQQIKLNAGIETL